MQCSVVGVVDVVAAGRVVVVVVALDGTAGGGMVEVRVEAALLATGLS
jgi:hypothetical protein